MYGTLSMKEFVEQMKKEIIDPIVKKEMETKVNEFYEELKEIGITFHIDMDRIRMWKKAYDKEETRKFNVKAALTTKKTMIIRPNKAKIICPACSSTDKIKSGFWKTTQKYKCKKCGRTYAETVGKRAANEKMAKG